MTDHLYAGSPMRSGVHPAFTKTETLRRLRRASALVREDQGLGSRFTAEVGLRTTSVYSDTVPTDDFDWYGVNEDGSETDLYDHAGLRFAAGLEEVQRHGYVAHLYLYSTEDGDLETTCCVWLGTPDHEPVQLDRDGRSVLR